MQANKEQVAAAKEQVEGVFKDGFMEINGRKYVFTKTNHKKRLRVFGFATRHPKNLLEPIGTQEWDDLEALICSLVTFEDSTISKLPNHWDEHPEDYTKFMATAVAVICYPLQHGNATN